MNSQDLVHGALQYQTYNGGDLLDTINSNTFKSLPLHSQVDFLHTYANSGGPGPEAMSKTDKIKHVLGSAATMAAAAGVLGVGARIAKEGKGLGAFLPKAGHTAEEELAYRQEARALRGYASGPAQIGGLIGGVTGYKGMQNREEDKAYVRQNLANIRKGGSPLPLLFGSESLHGAKSGHFDQAGYMSHHQTLKSNLFPFGGA